MFKFSLIFIQTLFLFGFSITSTAKELPEFCSRTKKMWVVEEGKPVLKTISDLSLPERYACEYPEFGTLTNAVYKRTRVVDDSTCSECDMYNGQRQAIVDYRDLIHKVGLIGKKDSRRKPRSLDEERKFSSTGNIYPPESCGDSCLSGSATIIVSANVVLTASHLFYDDFCNARNGSDVDDNPNTKFWTGYIFSIQENGNYVDYQIENAEVFDGCEEMHRKGTKANGRDDFAVIKLKKVVRYKRKVVVPVNPIILTQKKYDKIRRSGKSIMASYGVPSQRRGRGRLEAANNQDMIWYINENIPLSEAYSVDQRGKVRIEHMGDTTKGASGGGILIPNGNSFDVFAVHTGVSRRDMDGNVITNQANGIHQGIIDLAKSYAK